MFLNRTIAIGALKVPLVNELGIRIVTGALEGVAASLEHRVAYDERNQETYGRQDTAQPARCLHTGAAPLGLPFVPGLVRHPC